jgi:hypothetical protein
MYFEVNRIDVHKDTQEITIFMKSSDPTKDSTPVTRRKDGDVVFERAMQPAVNTICYLVPGIRHSWVHFLFQLAVTTSVHNNVPHNSVLYGLLKPGIIHTPHQSNQLGSPWSPW